MKTCKLFFGMFLIELIALLCIPQSQSFFLGEDNKIEKRNLDYRDYLDIKSNIKLPLDSGDIDYDYYYLGDTYYEFIQAKIERDKVVLSEIVQQSVGFRGGNFIKIPDALFDKEAFKETFYFGSLGIPYWWLNDLEEDFKINYLFVGNNEKYGKDAGYGYGCWAFYDDENETLRVFLWSQQHLGLNTFKQNFRINN